MKLPFVSRKEYDELKERVADLERHFVTGRDASGVPTQTLADIPYEQREEMRKRLQKQQRGLSWPQRKALLEATDGFRKVV